MKKSTIILILFPFLSFAQSKHKLTFEIESGIHSYSMNKLNSLYIDSFAIPNKSLNSTLKMGNSFNLAIKYKPINLFDIGLYGKYQYGKTKGNPELNFFDDIEQKIITHKGEYTLLANAISIGITNSWYISHLLKFQEKESKFLNRFHVATELNLGIGFSKVTSDIRYPTYKVVDFYSYHTSTDFQGHLAVKLEYDYVVKPIISSIGLKFGYQYFRTQSVQDKYSDKWLVLTEQETINLDFSGFFSSIYFSFGK